MDLCGVRVQCVWQVRVARACCKQCGRTVLRLGRVERLRGRLGRALAVAAEHVLDGALRAWEEAGASLSCSTARELEEGEHHVDTDMDKRVWRTEG